jgi:hypothetical protein
MRAILVVATLCLAASAADLAGQSADGGLPSVVRGRLDAYLVAYEAALGQLVATERMTQRAGSAGISDDRGVSTGSRPRSLESDVAFVALPGSAGWLGYRDVRKMNGRAIERSGPALADLLRLDTQDGRERARALLLDGARYNLGAPRTINLPSLPLEFLHPRNGARFALEGAYAATVAGGCAATVQLRFVETARPTLIQRPTGGDMPSRIAAWVAPATGTLCRADVRTVDATTPGGIEAVVSVDFAREAGVDLVVPTRMREEFFVPPLSRGIGEAEYSNYRRFSTTARVVP